MIRLLLNGKKAGLPEIRTAIADLRTQGYTVEVRATWEHGDIHRFVREAANDGIPRIVAGGGDGTVNEIADAIAKMEKTDRPEVGILPLGTANDFATACRIPQTPFDALQLALNGSATPIDIVKANDRHFINAATGGFGAQVTTATPIQLKNFLGGGAYTLTGIIKALNFSPTSGKIQSDEFEEDLDIIIGAICNGRQAGGGQLLAPDALLNDGFLDVVMVTTFPAYDLNIVISELLNPTLDGQYVKRFKTKWVETTSQGNADQVNLDGEPFLAKKIRFEAIPNSIKLILPDDCPCII
jgi:lipid kinase YegS